MLKLFLLQVLHKFHDMLFLYFSRLDRSKFYLKQFILKNYHRFPDENYFHHKSFQFFFRYLRLLGRFRALTILRLDYPALSDQTLIALTNAAPRVLKTLHISVRDSDSRHHTITDTAWHNLVLVCPELTVSYTIGTIWYRVT